MYLNGNEIDDQVTYNSITILNDTIKERCLENNVKEGSSQSFNGKFYDFSLLFDVYDGIYHDISRSDALKINQYYKYIHNI